MTGSRRHPQRDHAFPRTNRRPNGRSLLASRQQLGHAQTRHNGQNLKYTLAIDKGQPIQPPLLPVSKQIPCSQYLTGKHIDRIPIQ